MTPLEDDVRAAMRATAEKIPPDPLPPLTMPERRPTWPGPSGRPWPQRPREWAIPLAAVALVGVVVAGSLALASVLTSRQAQPAGAAGAPAYYVALTSASGGLPRIVPQKTTATIRATATGQMLATITVPRPYRAFTGVAAAADDRTFVLVAAEGKVAVRGTAPLTRFYMLHFDPASRTAAGRVRLQALPATYVPAGSTVEDMALSADGTSLAAAIGDAARSNLHVYRLVTGTQHVWNWSACSKCGPAGLGLSFTGPRPRVLSWAADGRTLVFAFQSGATSENGIRLLNTDAAGTNLLADSKLALSLADKPIPYWHQVIITPDGRTILAVVELAQVKQGVSQQLVTFSTATGQQTAVLNQPPVRDEYEQIQWTSTSGSELLISGAQKGGGAGVLKDGRYTPIPWSSKIFAAAW